MEYCYTNGVNSNEVPANRCGHFWGMLFSVHHLQWTSIFNVLEYLE